MGREVMRAAVHEDDRITNGNSSPSHLGPPLAHNIAPASSIPRQQDDLIRQLQHQIADLRRHNSALLESLDARHPKIKAGTIEDGFSLKHYSASPSEIHREAKPLCNTEMVLLRGKGFRTQFYGPSYPGTLLSDMPECQSFLAIVADIIKGDPDLNRACNEARTLHKRKPSEVATVRCMTEKRVLEVLPPRDVVEPLIILYLDTFEYVHHVLHMPSFWKEYTRFWQDSDNRNGGSAALMLLMMACSHHVAQAEPSPSLAKFQITPSVVVAWVDTVESWLNAQSQKYLNLTYLQVSCILVLCKKLNGVKVKRSWTFVGTLMRFAISGGLHRDPSLLGNRISVFEVEMKRRIWASIVDLELQASIDRGATGSMLGSLRHDTRPPSHINDDEFDEPTTTLPQSRMRSQLLPISYLWYSRNTVELRESINTVVNDSTRVLPWPEVLSLEESVMEKIQEISAWSDEEPPQPQKSLGSEMAQKILHLQLRQCLLLLYRAAGQRATLSSEQRYARTTCIGVATSIIDCYEKMCYEVKGALLALRDDVFQSALSICYDLSRPDPWRSVQVREPKHKHSETIDRALDMLENQGTNLNQVWLLCAAHGSVMSASMPENARQFQQSAADTMIRLYRQIANQQGTPHNWNGTIQDNQTTEVSVQPHRQAYLGFAETPFTGQSSEVLDFADFDQWFLDEAWRI